MWIVAHILSLAFYIPISLGHVCYAAKVIHLVQEVPGFEPLTHIARNLLTSELTIEPTEPLCWMYFSNTFCRLWNWEIEIKTSFDLPRVGIEPETNELINKAATIELWNPT